MSGPASSADAAVIGESGGPSYHAAMIATDSPATLRQTVTDRRAAGDRIGCVMTMGALHAGHRRLIEVAAAESDFVVVTIFVNPTQFAPGEDFEAYPRPLADDLAVCQAAGAGLVFHPTAATMYPDGFQTSVSVTEVTQLLEGASRPTHFQGVTTVVLKLLNLVGADAAYFGQKDFQQQAAIRRMATDLHHSTAIRTVPTVRDADGLALSSGNAYLSDDERASALSLSRGLRAAREMFAETGDAAAAEQQMQTVLAESPAVQVDYAVVVDSVTLRWPEDGSPPDDPVALIAARVGSTRLIDNHRLADPWPG